MIQTPEFKVSERRAIKLFIGACALALGFSSMFLAVFWYGARQQHSLIEYDIARGFVLNQGTPGTFALDLERFGVKKVNEGSHTLLEKMVFVLNSILMRVDPAERNALLAAFTILCRERNEAKMFSFLENVVREHRLPADFNFRKVGS